MDERENFAMNSARIGTHRGAERAINEDKNIKYKILILEKKHNERLLKINLGV